MLTASAHLEEPYDSPGSRGTPAQGREQRKQAFQPGQCHIEFKLCRRLQHETLLERLSAVAQMSLLGSGERTHPWGMGLPLG